MRSDSMKTIRIVFLAGVLSFPACGEDAPPFRPDVAGFSEPRAGMLPYFQGRDMNPYWPPQDAGDERPDDLRRPRDFEFLTHTDTKFTPEDLKGKYTILNYFFTRCPGICPLITRNVKQVSAQIPQQSDLQFVSISVTPEYDGPPEMRHYREEQRVDQANWYMLTGKRATIYEMARLQFGADVRTDVEDFTSPADFVHTENVYLLDREGYLRGIYRARGMGDLERLVKELAVLREE